MTQWAERTSLIAHRCTHKLCERHNMTAWATLLLLVLLVALVLLLLLLLVLVLRLLWLTVMVRLLLLAHALLGDEPMRLQLCEPNGVLLTQIGSTQEAV